MKRFIAFITRILGPASGHPIFSGLLAGLLMAHVVVLGFCGLEWLIHWLPWPGGTK
ncbi:hypothetical protein KTE13_30135 [Burkholderia multivorans]|uniref:hypothetical protein n=1 Tax=Burkholderia multivorans TaxID=87883 RepID=UPI001C216C83|nr:hypothetical protein [Burkholderia multivorans]MBU9404007.1 hypothetical protein [Burkholderia multivorans]